MKVTNVGKSPVQFVTGQRLDPGASLEMDEALRRLNSPWIDGAIRSGALAVEGSVPETPEDIAGLSADEVNELLEAHGASTNGSLRERRKRLRKVMFIEE